MYLTAILPRVHFSGQIADWYWLVSTPWTRFRTISLGSSKGKALPDNFIQIALFASSWPIRRRSTKAVRLHSNIQEQLRLDVRGQRALAKRTDDVTGEADQALANI